VAEAVARAQAELVVEQEPVEQAERAQELAALAEQVQAALARAVPERASRERAQLASAPRAAQALVAPEAAEA